MSELGYYTTADQNKTESLCEDDKHYRLQGHSKWGTKYMIIMIYNSKYLNLCRTRSKKAKTNKESKYLTYLHLDFFEE